MKIEINAEQFLEFLDRPAFCVSDGIICGANHAAAERGVVPGEAVAPLLYTGKEEYPAFQDGHLFLTLCINGVCYSAGVRRLGDLNLFVLEHAPEDPKLRAFALAGQELRLPLGQVMAICDRLFPELAEQSEVTDVPEKLARVNRGLYQMLRLIGNMSDARSAGIARNEIRNVPALMDEIMERAAELCEKAGVPLHFENHPEAIYSLADAQKLERAIYNLLSNAIRYSTPGSEIRVRLTLRKKTILLTVRNPVKQTDAPVHSRMFDPFLREPGLSNGQLGLGLGITLARSVASSHGGALLVEQLPSGEICTTLSLPIRQELEQLRAPVLRIDYTGERDHGLVELSEFLPPELYLPNQL